MTDRIFLDTNVLVYTFNSDSVIKKTKAKELLDQYYSNPEYRISTQVIQEFCSVLLKKITPPIPEKNLSEFILTFPSNQIEIINVNTITKALSIKELFKYSLWDSLIIATAILAGCNILYTEDMSNNQIINDLTIVNPFL